LVRLRIEVKNLGKSLAELAPPPCTGKGITKMPGSCKFTRRFQCVLI
jgi:hypothetical protein